MPICQRWCNRMLWMLHRLRYRSTTLRRLVCKVVDWRHEERRSMSSLPLRISFVSFENWTWRLDCVVAVLVFVVVADIAVAPDSEMSNSFFYFQKDVAAFIKKEFDKKYNPTWYVKQWTRRQILFWWTFSKENRVLRFADNELLRHKTLYSFPWIPFFLESLISSPLVFDRLFFLLDAVLLVLLFCRCCQLREF